MSTSVKQPKQPVKRQPKAKSPAKPSAKPPAKSPAKSSVKQRSKPTESPQPSPKSKPSSRAPSRRPSTGSLAAPSPFLDSPLDEFLSSFRPPSIQWVAKYVIVASAVLIRAAVGLGPYSGLGQEPLHGDFEAQRHWMEITNHLPLKEWYYYDREWWGLDYPPLTAYHSWLLGFVGSLANPDWFALDASRGLEDYDLKSYMRFTVIVSEVLIYIPAVSWFVRWSGKHHKLSPLGQSMAYAAILFQPALILIDHGHFQYNSVMLGLALLAIGNLAHGGRLTASIFFVLALCFKQMALYYAPVIFAYLLGQCIFPRINVLRLAAIGIVVAVTFGVMFGPLIYEGGIELVLQSLRSIFPFGRGLWEDKVANFWCTANTFVKLKVLFTPQQLQLASLAATLLAILPAMGAALLRPEPAMLPWAFSASAWGFFLFSFQVHEKSVLLPLMPATLLLASSNPNVTAMVTWINNIATFSLWPLLHREDLVLQYTVVTFCWNWLIGALNPRSISRTLPNSWSWKVVVVLSYVAAFAIHAAEYFVDTSAQPMFANLPHIWVLANLTLSFACFGLFWLWNLYTMIFGSL